ncbi:MAG TPA: nucleotide exchange factor GrpE [Candidatus Anoxymicrobiaceae bacterium]
MTDAKKTAGPRGSDKSGREDSKATPPEDEVEIIDNGADADDTEAIEVEPEERIHALDEEVDEFAEQNTMLLDSLKRLKADFDNYRKRMLKEQTRILETAEADLITKLLPVIDNLQRALESAGVGEASGLGEGVAMVLELMLSVLAKEGLEVIDPAGEPFDPEHHEAMMVVETSECPEGTVVGVVQKGYRFNGLLLRPAMVRVSCPVKA